MPRWRESAFDTSRNLFDASLAAQRMLSQTMLRSGEQVREVLGAPDDASYPALAARGGDIYRAQAFLWATTGLAMGERVGRAIPGGTPFGAPAWPSRAVVIGTVAADLYLGYATLRERTKRTPKLVANADWELQHRRGATRMLDVAGMLGGTLIKAAQFASTRPDLLPAAYTSTLSTLQDRVPPHSWDDMKPAISHELGRPLSEVFDHVEPDPIAAASIAQVHRARLADGREVAIKAQYPEVEVMIEADLSALERTFATLSRIEPQRNLQPIADYLRWTLPLELDFRRESEAIEKLRIALAGRDDVLVPEVVGELTTGRLLVMELMEGVKITDRDALTAAGIEPGAVAELLNDVYADQLLNHNLLHADPHPGNILVQPVTAKPGQPRLVLLDHGLTLDLEPAFVATLDGMVSALRAGDLEKITDALRETDLPIDDDTDLDTLLGVVGILLGTDKNPGNDDALDLGNLARGLGASVGDIPPKLLLVGRAIGLLDGITRQLDPEFDSLEVVGRYTSAS